MLSVSQARGVTPYNALYREAPPDGGTLFRVQVYERIGTFVISVVKRPKRVKNCISWLLIITSRQNGMVWWFIHILRTENLQQLKGMESSKLGNEKGVPLYNRRYTTGITFLSVMVYKRVRDCFC